MAWVEKHGGGFRIRYRLNDGTLVSETGFDTTTAARARANDVESDTRRGTLTDPRAGQTLLEDWVHSWSDAHDVSDGTWAKYQSHLRNHILPRFGTSTLAEINRMAIKAWIKTLRHTLAESTVADVATLLSMLLGEAVEEGLIAANPCRKLRINTNGNPERPHAQPWQVQRIVQRCRPTEQLLILTAAYTGMRWGELAGLQWAHVHLSQGQLVIDPHEGALHDTGGQLTLGPPKTAASARTVHLPPFLINLLAEHHASEDHPFVFTGTDGGLLRRSNFRNRVWLPAVEGHTTRGWAPLFPGLHFHDLRHTHKTWLIEDAVPEVAQFKRLGHRLAGVRGIYSHVTQPMIDALLTGLQRRWEQTGSTDPVTTTEPEM
jgi:integrase